MPCTTRVGGSGWAQGAGGRACTVAARRMPRKVTGTESGACSCILRQASNFYLIIIHDFVTQLIIQRPRRCPCL
jgi:hypothetical protein